MNSYERRKAFDERWAQEQAFIRKHLREDGTSTIDDLEAQIRRLQAYVEELESTIRGEYPYADEMIIEDRAKYLHPGDLDPIGGEQ